MGCDYSVTGGTDCGYNIDTSTSELAYMWYNILGNTPFFDVNGIEQANWGLNNTGADGVNFSNIQSDLLAPSTSFYWTRTEYASSATSTLRSSAWTFNSDWGMQNFNAKEQDYFAWAVRSGDVTVVPVPAAVWLFGSGLIGLIGIARRKRTY